MPATLTPPPLIARSAALPLSQYDIPLDSIRSQRMQTIFRALGIAVGSTSSADGREAEVLLEHLPASEELRWIFEAVNALGTTAGREELIKWLRANGVDPYETHPADENQVDETAQELALRIALMARGGNQAAKEALRQAMLRCEVRKHRATCCYTANDPRPVEWSPTAHGPAIRTAVLSELSQQRIIPFVECQAYSEPGGVLVLTVTHGEQNRAITYLTEAGQKTIRVPPATVDVIRYAPRSGVISFSCRQTSMVRAYLRILGRVLFDDEQFFCDRPLFNLAHLLNEEAVRDAAEKISGLRSAKVTTLQVRDDEEGGVITVRHSKGVFHQLRKLGRRLIVLNASITFVFYGGRGEKDDRVVVRLKPPHGLAGLESTRHEPAINQFLEILRLYEVENQERNPKDWQAFDPWILNQAELRRITRGIDPAPLINANLIVPTQRAQIDHPMAGPGLVDVVDVQGGHVAVPVPGDPAGQLIHVTPTDLTGYRCDLVQQAVVLGRALGCEGPIGDTCCEGRVIDCGWKDVTPGRRIRVYLLRSQLRDEDCIILRARAEEGFPIGLVPDVARPESGSETIRVAPITLPAVAFDDLWTRLARAAGFYNHISTLDLCRNGTQFAFDEVNNAVFWAPSRQRLEFAPDQMRFLWVLARAYPEPASHADLVGNERESKKVKLRLVKSLERVIGPGYGDLVKPRSGVGYRLDAEIVYRRTTAA